MHAPPPHPLVSLLPVGWWTTDLNLRLVSTVINDELKREIERTGSFPGFGDNKTLDLRYPQHPDVAAHLRARAGETVVWNTGSTGSLRACVTPLKADDGRVVGVAGAAVDLATFHREETRRLSAEQLLYALIENTGDALALLDSDGRIIFANDHYCKALGKQRMDVLGREEQLPTARGSSNFATAKRGNGDWRSTDNTKRYRSVRFDFEAPTGSNITCHVARDVTDELALGEQIDELNFQYRALFTENPRPMAFIGRDMTLVRVNCRFGNVLDAHRSDLAGSFLLDWLHPASINTARILFQDEREECVNDSRTYLLFKTGKGRLVQALFDARRLEGLEGASHPVLFLELRRWGSPGELDSLLVPALDAMEREILELLAAGRGNAAIAETLCLSRQGLDYRIKRLRERMDAESRAALIARAYSLGLLDPKQWPPKVAR